MADRRSPRRADYEIFLPIKPAYVLDRDPQRLRGHGSQIVGCQPLPTGPRREIEGSFVDKTGRFEADPGPPNPASSLREAGQLFPHRPVPMRFRAGHDRKDQSQGCAVHQDDKRPDGPSVAGPLVRRPLRNLL